MTVLPVVARELRVASRRRSTFLGRVGAACLGVVIATWMLLVQARLGFGKSGEGLFYALAVVAMGFALLAGMLYSADSVSSEKREGTLGLLFLTDLRGADVALGKLAATSLGAFYGLLAVLPLLAISLLLGGVTVADFWRMVLVLVVTLFASLALGLLASVIATDVRRAVLLTFMMLLGLTFGGPVISSLGGWVLERMGQPRELATVLLGGLDVLSPFAGFTHVESTRFRTTPTNYWWAAGFTGGIGLLALALASWWLPHAWQEKAANAQVRGLRGWLERVRFPRTESRSRFRAAVLDRNAVTWLTARHWLRPWLVWGLLGVTLLAAYIFGREDQGQGIFAPELGVAVSIFLHVALKFWMANEAPRQFLDDRRSGAMELLLATPLTPGDIVHGRWLALRWQFLGPVVVMLGLDAVWILLASATNPGDSFKELIWVWIAWMGILVLDLWALGWAGLWAGMTTRGRATTSLLVTRVLVLPWVLWLGGVMFAGAGGGWGGTGDGSFAFWLMLGSWFGLGALNDVFWAAYSKRSFESSFREAATQRPGAAKARWWRRGTALE